MSGSNAEKRKAAAAAVSLATNLALMIAKGVVALISGSVSVLSEALHSIGDVIASAIAYFGVRVSDRPADPEHPYGHGNAESLAGLAESVLLVGAGVYVGIESIHRFRDPEPIQADVAIVVIAATAVVNILISRYLTKAARETDSRALEADAAHLTADFVTSLGVLAALVLVRTTGLLVFDPLIALGLSIWIIVMGGRIALSVMQQLMDARLPAEEVSIIEGVFRAHKEVLGWHQLRTRKSGSRRHIDGHIMLRDELSLVEAHEITEEVEDKIRAELPNVSISLHMEPYTREKAHRQMAHPDDRPTK
ncbi:MAG TPA: cation diffusion facilitator family transporter [Fimbriimonadales bacterium]|jgi:cation diffusion facilitator family transporter|nr:cation diffusion facilitator family transporter [Fimbriimonadales bacterium]